MYVDGIVVLSRIQSDSREEQFYSFRLFFRTDVVRNSHRQGIHHTVNFERFSSQFLTNNTYVNATTNSRYYSTWFSLCTSVVVFIWVLGDDDRFRQVVYLVFSQSRTSAFFVVSNDTVDYIFLAVSNSAQVFSFNSAQAFNRQECFTKQFSRFSAQRNIMST